MRIDIEQITQAILAVDNGVNERWNAATSMAHWRPIATMCRISTR